MTFYRPRNHCAFNRIGVLARLFIGLLLCFASSTCQPNTESKRKEMGLALTLDTELGTVRCTLFDQRAPRTVALIRGLADAKTAFRDHRTGLKHRGRYYDGLRFFRRIPGVMVQTGCPIGDGTGHPGFRIEAELHADDKTLLREPGALVMARYHPPENRLDPDPPPPGKVIGSQFAITLQASIHLAGQLPVVGRCRNLDVVRRLSLAKHEPILKRLRVTPIYTK